MSSSKILVPLDGSPASLRALDFAVEQLVRNKETRLYYYMSRISDRLILQEPLQ